MPGICDPGENIVSAAKFEGIGVICIPGACAAITALVSSGMKSSKFIFEGFLPKKNIDREKILLEISKNKKTTIIYESPHRLKKLLKELLEYCGGEREIIVARELTKRFEEHIGNNIKNVIEHFKNKEVMGEITLIIGGEKEDQNQEFNKAEFKTDLQELIKAGLSISAAPREISS